MSSPTDHSALAGGDDRDPLEDTFFTQAAEAADEASCLTRREGEVEDDDVNPEDGGEGAVVSAHTFAGDTGQLSMETRRVLVQLLLGPYVDARRKARLWLVLLRDEVVLRSRLHELFLELVIDRDQKVAFTRQLASPDLDLPILLRKATLTYIESALLLFLRQRMTQADTQGERAVVSHDEMLEHLRVFEPQGNPDEAKFERQMENAIDKAKKLNLLHSIRGGAQRFEVSPTLKLLFSAEEIQVLTRTYRAIAGTAFETDAPEPDAESHAPDSDIGKDVRAELVDEPEQSR